jgi:hypothetical protein
MANVVRGSIVAVLLAALGFVTWGALGDDGPGPFADEIADGRARWEAAGIDDYTIHIDLDCYCSWYEVTATIVDGEVEAAFDQDGAAIEPYELRRLAPVDELLDRAEHANAGRRLAGFESDPELGYPTVIEYVTDDDVDHSGGTYTITVTI